MCEFYFSKNQTILFNNELYYLFQHTIYIFKTAITRKIVELKTNISKIIKLFVLWMKLSGRLRTDTRRQNTKFGCCWEEGLVNGTCWMRRLLQIKWIKYQHTRHFKGTMLRKIKLDWEGSPHLKKVGSLWIKTLKKVRSNKLVCNTRLKYIP